MLGPGFLWNALSLCEKSRRVVPKQF
jgi:hypothetical protein